MVTQARVGVWRYVQESSLGSLGCDYATVGVAGDGAHGGVREVEVRGDSIVVFGGGKAGDDFVEHGQFGVGGVEGGVEGGCQRYQRVNQALVVLEDCAQSIFRR